MKGFLKEFKKYDDCAPAGVLLPRINIEEKYYEALGVPSDTSNFEFLRQLCLKGVKNKQINELPNSQTYYDRAKMELDILNDLGFVDYVLLNWDILNYCHENDIPTGPGRGSAAGSLVLFLIGVTQINPVQYDLFFERFVSKSRAKKIEKDGVIYLDGSLLADIDNDIAYEHRQKVIEYIENKYPGRTSKILTLNTLSGKLCIRECSKIVEELDESEANIVSDLIPKKFGKVVALSTASEDNDSLQEWIVSHKKAFKIALKLEGLKKNTGVHPSGIAISHQKIADICPIQKTNDGAYVTGYDMNWVAELMVKFDILGLRTLSVIDNTSRLLGSSILDIDFNDPLIYESLQDLRRPHGLFQIEADTDYRVCRKIKPKNLEELSAVVAIARPGALDFLENYARFAETGEQETIHVFFDDVLRSTGGIPLYQEQLMQMAVKVGFSLDEAEQIRRIIGKKKVDQMPAWKRRIESQVQKSNLPEEVGDILWRVAEDSANYSFNKSHAIAYATLSAFTTYLKFKHPQEFFLSLLEMTKFEPAPHEEITRISQELPHFNINLLPPDLAKSKMNFSTEGADIRFGLNSIKGVSEKSLQALRDFRDSDAPTKFDIFLSAKQAGLNIGILSALIQAGALSSYKSNRSLLVLEAQAFNLLTDREKRNAIAVGDKYDYALLKIIADARDQKLMGDDNRPFMKPSRFETFKKKYTSYKKIYEKNKKYEGFANWYFETKLLGYSYTSKLKDVFSSSGTLIDSESINNLSRNVDFKFVGKVDDFIKRTSRNGNEYIKFELSDEVGNIECLLMNNRRRDRNGRWIENKRLDRFNERNTSKLTKGNIILLRAVKGEDASFVEDAEILDNKIYMKLGDLK